MDQLHNQKPASQTRKLAAILFADIVGYTALMQEGETNAMSILSRFQAVCKAVVGKNHGEIIKSYGDGSIILFNSTVDAVQCGLEIQMAFQEAPKVPLRVGIHVGEIVHKDNDVFGNGVNIASRVESMGIAGSVLLTKDAQDKISNQEAFETVSLGSHEFKNVKEPIEIFALSNQGIIVPRRDQMKGKVKSATKKKSKWLVPALLGLLLTIGGSFYFFNQSNIAASSIPDAITIFPFDVKSGSPDIQYLGEGMVDLISIKLDGVPNLNPIDPNRVFNELKKEKTEFPALELATEISNRLGAAEYILGSIIEINDALQISASKYDSNGDLITKESIEGQKTQLASLIEDLTKMLIADKLEQEGQDLNSLAVMTSNNLTALKAYLQGEQTARNGDPIQASNYFQSAVDLDSTFALAWYRLYNAQSWFRLSDSGNLDKALQYGDDLSPKWLDLIKAGQMLGYGHSDTEEFIANLIRKYGENAQLNNLMAEWLVHLNPVYGRSIIEAKPWLEKSFALDPQNLETRRHLVDIAQVENNIAAIRDIQAQLPKESVIWLKCQEGLLVLQDTVTEDQIKALVSHRYFNPGFSLVVDYALEDHNTALELGLRFGPYIKNDLLIDYFDIQLARLKGQEKKAFNTWQIVSKKISTNASWKISEWTNPALIIASRAYLPLDEQYQNRIDSLTTLDTPLAFFASAKYAWALNQEEVYQANKQKLTAASKENYGIINPARYFYWSLKAFEARQNKDNEKALTYIDSVYHYSPDSSFRFAQQAVMDKTFMLADIYEEQQAYKKSIQRLENIPAGGNYYLTKGYATYRLTQLYEKNEDVNNALAKCDLFLKNYKDCDEKYRPWLEEVRERRKRLINKII